jgi:hypothetical protein
MHPEYPSQAAIICGVAVSVLEAVFGQEPRIPFTVTDAVNPKTTRNFPSLKTMADEHADVRIWGGIHFRNSLGVGEDMGRKIGAHLVANTIKAVGE